MSRAHSYSHSRAHSPTIPSLHLCHNSFSNPSVALPTSQLILQPFRHLTCVTAHSPTLPSFHLRHSSFFNTSVVLPTSQLILNPSVASPTLQLILQPFRHFTYITAHFPTLPSLYIHHSSFSNPSVSSPSSQIIPQPFFCFSYITSSSLNSPGEPLMTAEEGQCDLAKIFIFISFHLCMS